MANIKGLIEARRAFKALPELHRELIVEVHTQSAAAIVRAASSRAPKRTGLLARSIKYDVSTRTGYGKVGIELGPAYYGHFVEFGTIYQPARPFMQPAAEAERGRIEGRFLAAGKTLEAKAERIGGRFL